MLLQISKASKTQLKKRDDVLSAEAQMSNAPKTKGEFIPYRSQDPFDPLYA